MAIYAMLGIIVVAAIFAVGTFWLLQNVTFKQPNPYEYKTDENGNETVKDNTDA
jgi:NADH:ubiquinone oxidoreductase subunit 3 (subunit A)